MSGIACQFLAVFCPTSKKFDLNLLPEITVEGGQQLTEGNPGFDARNLGVCDVFLDKRGFTGLFEQVPHLDSAIFFPNVENCRSGRGPACCSAHLLRVWRQDDGTFLNISGLKTQTSGLFGSTEL